MKAQSYREKSEFTYKFASTPWDFAEAVPEEMLNLWHPLSLSLTISLPFFSQSDWFGLRRLCREWSYTSFLSDAFWLLEFYLNYLPHVCPNRGWMTFYSELSDVCAFVLSDSVRSHDAVDWLSDSFSWLCHLLCFLFLCVCLFRKQDSLILVCLAVVFKSSPSAAVFVCVCAELRVTTNGIS